MLRRDREWATTSKRFTSVAVALNGSDGSRCALSAALALCDEADAQLTILALGSRLSPRSTVGLGADRANRRRESAAATALDEAKSSRAMPMSTSSRAGYCLRPGRPL